MEDKPLSHYIENAAAYKQIGQTEINLYKDVDVSLYSMVHEAGPGGCFRMSIPVSLRFKAAHPCGLTFAWFVDIEKHGADGSGYYQIDTDALRAVMAKVPATVCASLRAHFNGIAEKIHASAKELRDAADKQSGMAFALERLAG